MEEWRSEGVEEDAASVTYGWVRYGQIVRALPARWHVRRKVFTARTSGGTGGFCFGISLSRISQA
jgi:hypothetical protein